MKILKFIITLLILSSSLNAGTIGIYLAIPPSGYTIARSAVVNHTKDMPQTAQRYEAYIHDPGLEGNKKYQYDSYLRSAFLPAGCEEILIFTDSSIESLPQIQSLISQGKLIIKGYATFSTSGWGDCSQMQEIVGDWKAKYTVQDSTS